MSLTMLLRMSKRFRLPRQYEDDDNGADNDAFDVLFLAAWWGIVCCWLYCGIRKV